MREQRVRRAPRPPIYRIDHYRWRVIKRNHKAHSRSHRLPCWLHEYGMCVFNGAPIDYDAPPQAPMAYETDHYHPRATHPHLMYMWSNLRASHCKCNRTRKAKDVGAQAVWIRPTF